MAMDEVSSLSAPLGVTSATDSVTNGQLFGRKRYFPVNQIKKAFVRNK